MSGEDTILVIPCQGCGGTLARVERVEEGKTRFDLYQCADDSCRRKVAVIFEPVGGLAAEESTYIQREIARRGAFFPADYGSSGGRGFGRL